METQAFRTLMAKVRAGDHDAAAALVRDYEPELRRVIRVRLTDPRLRRLDDTSDVCQSVLANFFVRVTAGEFDLDRPENLLHLLLRMARNKILDKARRQNREKRDQRRLDAGAADDLDRLPGKIRDPASIVVHKELLMRVRERLSDDERDLADQRALGREWSDLAAERGIAAEALRKRLSRALDRALADLGIDQS